MASILSLPVLANGFRRLIKPLAIRQQGEQFDGAEKLDRIRIRPAQCRSLPAVTRMATSSVEQFRSFATCAASSLAGRSFAAQVVIAACVMSSVIRQLFLGIGILQAIPSGPPPTRRSAPGWVAGLAGSHPFLNCRNLSAFYRSANCRPGV